MQGLGCSLLIDFVFRLQSCPSCGNCNPNFFPKHPFFWCYFVLFLHLFSFRSPEIPTGSLRRCLAWEPQLHPHLLFGIARLPTWLTLQQPNREPQQIHGTNLPLIALSPHQLIKYIKMSTPITRRRLQVLTHTSFSF